MIDLFQSLADLSGLLYDGNTPSYPVQLYRTFRQVFESTKAVTSILENYEPNTEKFEAEKEQLLEQHFGYMNTIVSFQQLEERDYPI